MDIHWQIKALTTNQPKPKQRSATRQNKTKQNETNEMNQTNQIKPQRKQKGQNRTGQHITETTAQYATKNKPETKHNAQHTTDYTRLPRAPTGQNGQGWPLSHPWGKNFMARNRALALTRTPFRDYTRLPTRAPEPIRVRTGLSCRDYTRLPLNGQTHAGQNGTAWQGLHPITAGPLRVRTGPDAPIPCPCTYMYQSVPYYKLMETMGRHVHDCLLSSGWHGMGEALQGAWWQGRDLLSYKTAGSCVPHKGILFYILHPSHLLLHV